MTGFERASGYRGNTQLSPVPWETYVGAVHLQMSVNKPFAALADPVRATHDGDTVANANRARFDCIEMQAVAPSVCKHLAQAYRSNKVLTGFFA